MHGSLKKSGSTPKKIEMKLDSIDEKQHSPISVFKVSNTNHRANFELEKMRIEQNNEKSGASEHLPTE